MASIILTGPAHSSDLEKLYPEQLKQAKNLYNLAYRYFKGPGSLEPGETLTPEMVKSPLRQEMLYKIRRLVGLAVDAGYDLSALEEFGLIKEQNVYAIYYQNTPQWARISGLFTSLQTPEDLQYAANPLMRRGFSQFDIDIVKKYLSENNPQKQMLAAERAVIAQYTPKSSMENTVPLGAALKAHESIRKARVDSWNQWGVNLLNKLGLHKQRILLSYLQQNLGVSELRKYPISIEYLNFFGSELASGKQLALFDSLVQKQQ